MQILRKLTSDLKVGFIGDIFKLSFGTIIGRLIALAALPLLTRLYTPDDFSILATYLAIVSILSVSSCLRFEVAIPLVEADSEAAELLVLSIIVLFIITLILSIPALVLADYLAKIIGSPALAQYLWLVPLGVLMSGSYSALQFWATRARRFGEIARTRISQAVGGVSTMIILGYAGLAPIGLLLGNLINISAGSVGLGVTALVRDREVIQHVRMRRLGSTFKRNQVYPLLSTPDSLFNIAGTQIPILLIASHAGPEAGFLLLAMQVIAAPMALLGSSIAQVYVSRAPQEYREGRLAPFTISIMRRLAWVGGGPLIMIGMLSPLTFPILFGENWIRAGELMPWLVPWMLFQFIASPVSMVMYVLGRQRAMLALTTIGMMLRIGLTFSILDTGFAVVEAFALISAAFYIICCCVFVHAATSSIIKLDKV